MRFLFWTVTIGGERRVLIPPPLCLFEVAFDPTRITATTDTNTCRGTWTSQRVRSPTAFAPVTPDSRERRWNYLWFLQDKFFSASFNTITTPRTTQRTSEISKAIDHNQPRVSKMTSVLRRSRRAAPNKNSTHNVGDIVEVSWRSPSFSLYCVSSHSRWDGMPYAYRDVIHVSCYRSMLFVSRAPCSCSRFSVSDYP